jgi:hypothetical protein
VSGRSHSGNSQSTPETFAAGDGRRGPISEATGPGFFDEVGGGLLVLGALGAGKTTVLQLARELLDRAERTRGDQSKPSARNSFIATAATSARMARRARDRSLSAAATDKTSAGAVAVEPRVRSAEDIDFFRTDAGDCRSAR